MKFKYGILFIFLIVTNIGNAQSIQGFISGKVLDEKGEFIPYATISLFDSSQKLIAGTITSEKGKFNFSDVLEGSYTLEVSFLGYDKNSVQINISSSQKKINLKAIVLEESPNAIDEVLITAEKSQFMLKMDKKVFNVGKDVLAQGGNALDILDQIPQVSVQPSGSVELRGSSAVQILINGKRSGLTMNNALDQLDIENIDNIEVITNPSAQYDANGSAGIINIILKKNKGEGFKGALRSTIGTPANHILMPSLSYKSQRVNLFGNLRWRYSDYNGLYQINQNNKSENSFELNSSEVEDRHDDGLSFYVGGDYYLNDKSDITLAYFRANTKDTDQTHLDYKLVEQEGDMQITRSGNSLEKRNYNQLEASFQHKINDRGSKFSLTLQYDFWNSKKDWQLNTTAAILPDNIEANLRTFNASNSRDLVINTDIEWPVLGGQFKTGLKAETRKVNNNFLAENLNEDIWATYKSIDSDVAYSEMISAGYIDFSRSFEKLQIKIGLRGEHSDITIDDTEFIFENKKRYFNLFPSGFISYPINDGVEVQAGFSRRINRPSLWDLYLFNDITNINLLEIGNPELDPSYTNGFEVSASFQSEKISFNPGIYHRRSTNTFETFISQNNDGFLTSSPINIDGMNETGIEFTVRYRPLDILNINVDFNYYLFDQFGYYNGLDMSAEGNVWRSRINSNLRINKTLRIMASYQYRGPQNNAQVNYLASSDLSLSISQSYFDSKLDVSIRGSNILDTRRWQSVTDNAEYSITQNLRRTGPRYSLNLTYKFNYSDRDRIRTQNRGNR